MTRVRKSFVKESKAVQTGYNSKLIQGLDQKCPRCEGRCSKLEDELRSLSPRKRKSYKRHRHSIISNQVMSCSDSWTSSISSEDSSATTYFAEDDDPNYTNMVLHLNECLSASSELSLESTEHFTDAKESLHDELDEVSQDYTLVLDDHIFPGAV